MHKGYSITRDYGFQEQTTHSDQYGQIYTISTHFGQQKVKKKN